MPILGRDLLSFGTPILVLGDPSNYHRSEGCGFFTEAEPDIMLTEIHRQARDNPIIRMSMDIREGRPLRYGDYGSSRIIASWQELQESTAEVDQFIVGRNSTRMYINRRECRDSAGRPVARRQAGVPAQQPPEGSCSMASSSRCSG